NTWTVLTGGGGRHLYFAPDARITTAEGGLPPGINVRGHGGYVMVPPSIHPDTRRPYAWAIGCGPRDLPLPTAPKWLLDLILHGGGDRLRHDGTPLVIRQGERNHRLHQLGSALRRYGFGERAILGALQVINAEHCVPPLDDVRELARIAASAAKYEPEHAATSRRERADRDLELLILAARGRPR